MQADANKGKITGQLPLATFFWILLDISRKITKGLCFHITFKTADLKGICIYYNDICTLIKVDN